MIKLGAVGSSGLPWPGREFAIKFGSPESWHAFNLRKRKRLLCAAAYSGHAASLEVALAHAGVLLDAPMLDAVVSAAALGGHLEACAQLLVHPVAKPPTYAPVETVDLTASDTSGGGRGGGAGGGRAGNQQGGGAAPPAGEPGESLRYRVPPEEAVTNAAAGGHVAVLRLLLQARNTAAVVEVSASALKQRLAPVALAACGSGQLQVLDWLDETYQYAPGFAEVEAAAKAGQVELFEVLLRPRPRSRFFRQRVAALRAALRQGLTAVAAVAAGAAAAPADGESEAGGCAAGTEPSSSSLVAASVSERAAIEALAARVATALAEGAAVAAAATAAAAAPAAAAADAAAATATAAAAAGAGGEAAAQQPPPQQEVIPLTNKQRLSLLCAMTAGLPLPALQRHFSVLWLAYETALLQQPPALGPGEAAAAAGAADTSMMSAMSDLLFAAISSHTPCWREKWEWLRARLALHEPANVVLQRMLINPGPHNRSEALEAACGPLPQYCQRLRVLHAAGMQPTSSAVERAIEGGHPDAVFYLWKQCKIACRVADVPFQTFVMNHSRGCLGVLMLMSSHGMVFTPTHVKQAASRGDWPEDSLMWLLDEVRSARRGGAALDAGGGAAAAQQASVQAVWTAAATHAAHHGYGVPLLRSLVERGASVSLAAVAEGGSVRTLAWAARLRGEEARRVHESGNLAAVGWLQERQLLGGRGEADQQW
ncbi:hypothetical protein HYH02_012194 [Chlamydomonas schloesseri]|uniref:Uncharacterized protein n=1 Tax=Chlamydomonas schloesseri TaxID=2026947 RepID=A0A835SWC6_9CHLO|nr:hypothetical protein HYH02_012194 [Chlamydomonas schloesseri]|eukprot:KAG2434527.1 hypothetical protein HYH02_012194 [Chlamydomonas schloesseri]